MRRFGRAVAVAAVVVAGCATVSGPGPGGTRPTYLEAVTSGAPNESALGRRIWTPALDDGWVPQGLTASGAYLYVSSYKPTPDLKANTGPCRVFRIERESGRDAGGFDLPVGACTHSGGLEALGDGRLFLADTRRIFLIEIERALASGKAEGAMKSLALAGDLRGSFAAFDGTDLWIGTWTKDPPKARMFRLETKLFDAPEGSTIDHARAAESIPIPPEAQGAVFDGQGDLWVSASDSKFGRLYRLSRQGAVQARYEMVPGLEDLAFDGKTLWGLSESGTRKYLHWATRFPFIFEIDVAKLVESPRSAEERVMDITQAACDAFRLGDTAAAERLLAPEFTLISSRATVQTRDQAIAEIRAGGTRYDDFRNHGMSARVYGDAAVVQGITSLKGVSDGQPFAVDVRFTDTLVRRQGEWKIVVSHVTRIPPK